jgi:hypothetical protein
VTRAFQSTYSSARVFSTRWVGLWRDRALSWMMLTFLIGLALAAIVFLIFGTGDRGMALALRVTARWSFLPFWLAYAGGAMATLFGSRFDSLARRGRELGLAFASAQLVHLGLIVWLYQTATDPVGAMTFFWGGAFCTYLLALFSLPRLRGALEPRIWRALRAIAVEYIALVFAYDFIFGPLEAIGRTYPLSYVPFALVLAGGTSMRVIAFASRLRARADSASRP